MRRREFIILLGGGATASILAPCVARSQQRVSVIGFLSANSLDVNRETVAAFRRGLVETGFVEGRNVAIEYRAAEGHYDRLPEMAADLVRRRVAVIVAGGSSAPGLAAKAATSTIPIVFQTGNDPVEDGLVASMNRPGGNVIGVSRMSLAIESKRLELLHDAAPLLAAVIAYLVNPSNPRAQLQIRHMQESARLLGIKLQIVMADTQGDPSNELTSAFASMVSEGARALVVTPEPTYSAWADRIGALALRHRIPIMFPTRESVPAGGLMSYDSSITESYREVGVYTGRILKGEKPADLPVLQPTRFEFVLNLKTAKALGLYIPLKLHAFADEVIE
jgi:putative tryptophan/tyrosine transport system substrate-binding protein